ncbi:metal ABC transporter substrate-binding protein [Paracoccus aerodenitrificans]|uniref:metal ABC transporter substrate-binding protein n=1 Tax=Paracoccus aerodenitrificans TaxID=3017781 RepID=UPI0022F0D31E|nr:metal ABC transporter substrate-binding protein [Paracoccus aerodenitrificans]WBU64062.1 metal ABC transporter substrate-binding protein [Paracoccus aerodenitrificans]
MMILTNAGRKIGAALGLLALSLLPGQAQQDQPQQDRDRMKVVTTFTVLADIAQNVAGDAADVVSITKPGAEIHRYQPTPRDFVRSQGADLVLRNGMNLEAWFEQFLSNLGDLPSVTLTDGITPIPVAQGAYQGLPNPHAWMGLENASRYIDNIAAAFAEHDPANAETYRRNADRYKQQLRAEIEPLRDRIAALPESRRWLVTCEGAFSYLAQDFGLRELYLWPMNAERMGTPQQIREVIDGVRDNAIPTVFCESTVNTAPARQIARETGASYGGELYVDSLSVPDGPVPSYIDLLRVTSATIAEGLETGLNE